MSENHTPGLVVLYRWRLVPGHEARFAEAWSAVTQRLLETHGSLGSRLHRGPDGLWYGYAQWPSAEVRDRAFATDTTNDPMVLQMRAAVEENFVPLELDPIADFLVLPVAPDP